jgi:hypothetical protein
VSYSGAVNSVAATSGSNAVDVNLLDAAVDAELVSEQVPVAGAG